MAQGMEVSQQLQRGYTSYASHADDDSPSDENWSS